MKKTAKKDSNIKHATTQEELEAIAREANGPVAVVFTASWCGACETEKPKVAELAKCTTTIEVDVDQAPELADSWNVEAMPSVFVANGPEALQPGKAEEFDDASAAMKRFKCSRKKG